MTINHGHDGAMAFHKEPITVHHHVDNTTHACYHVDPYKHWNGTMIAMYEGTHGGKGAPHGHNSEMGGQQGPRHRSIIIRTLRPRRIRQGIPLRHPRILRGIPETTLRRGIRTRNRIPVHQQTPQIQPAPPTSGQHTRSRNHRHLKKQPDHRNTHLQVHQALRAAHRNMHLPLRRITGRRHQDIQRGPIPLSQP